MVTVIVLGKDVSVVTGKAGMLTVTAVPGGFSVEGDARSFPGRQEAVSSATQRLTA